MTLEPQPENIELARQTPVWCLLCGSYGLVDVLLNVLLFAPYGAGLRLAGLRGRPLLLVLFCTTLAVELLQMGVIPGRDASVSDLLTNSGGGLLGAWLAARWDHVIDPGPRARRRLVAAGMGAWVVVMVFSAWAVGRQLPRRTYYGQWAPSLAGLQHFEGEVLAVDLEGMQMPRSRMDHWRRVRLALSRDTVHLTVRAVSAAPTRGLAPIFNITDIRGADILMLGQYRDDIMFRLRTRSRALGLRAPTLRVPNALPHPGDTVTIRASWSDDAMQVMVLGRGGVVLREQTLHAALGWTLPLPYEYAFGGETTLLTMLWIAGLVFPLAYWSRGLGPKWDLALAGVVVLGLAGTRWLTSVAVVPWPAWLAAAIGAAAGRRAAQWVLMARRAASP